MTRYARKVDANQALVVHGLRKRGCDVALTHMVAGGFPDLACCVRCPSCFSWITCLVEVKRTAKSAHTLAQVEWRGAWRGLVITATDAQDVIAGVKNWCCP